MKLRRSKHKGFKKRSLKNWIFNHTEILAVSFFVVSLLTLGFGYHLSTRKPQVKGASVTVKQPLNNTSSAPFDPTTDTGGALPQGDTSTPDDSQANPTPTPATPKPTTSTLPDSNQSNSSGSGSSSGGSGGSGSTTPKPNVYISADTCLVTVTGATAGDTLDVLANPSGAGNGTFTLTTDTYTTSTPAAQGDTINATLHDTSSGDIYATPATCNSAPSSPSP